jgi:D-sedoheptulose 7-phosphate isomerase
MAVNREELVARTRQDLLRRNQVCTAFFRAEAPRLAAASGEMARRFLAGGRLLAFGLGAAATDAQHVAVEFVHPVIMGKRALPALDLGQNFESSLPLLVQPQDMVLGFDTQQQRNGPSGAVVRALQAARERGALTFALAGEVADYPFALPDEDPFVCQEVFEILYHILWETVHVYFEHREQGHDVGASAFLYPFLGKQEQSLESVVTEVQGSMLQKADEVNRLRTAVAETGSEVIVETAEAIAVRLKQGGKIIAFGNGGSATDANDLVLDCVAPPPGFTPVPALSLAAEPATLTAIANDIGSEAIFTRQLIAHSRPGDVAIGFSTSGGSANILAALAEARKRELLTVGIVGYDGGKIVSERLADHALVVPSDYIPRIQEVQASVYHVVRDRIEDLLAPQHSGNAKVAH